MISAFGKRWLILCGVLPGKAEAKCKLALLRALRYPWPHRWLYFIILPLVDRIGPLLTIKRMCRAAHLPDDLFELYIRRLKELSNPSLYKLCLFAFMPFMEALADDKPPARTNLHPLEDAGAFKSPDSAQRFDVIIIGSGAGGAPAALELSRKGMKVAVIERGGIVELKSAPQMLEHYFAGQGLISSVSGGTLLVLAGCTVGGTTSVNSGTCLKPLRSCLETWDEQIKSSFAAGELDPFIERAERHIGVTVPQRKLLSKSAVLFEAGLGKLGRPGAYLLPRSAPACEGSGRCCFGCPTGAKQSTDYSFLPQAVKAGTALLINTRATKIIEKKDRVLVEVTNGGICSTLTCSNLIIAGGALFTPGLLLRNRLGSQLKHAGKHMKIHPATKVFAWFPDLDHGEGGVPQGLGYRPPELPRISLEGIHTPKALISPIISVGGERFNWWFNRANELASFGLMVQDRGRGWLNELNSFPWINYNLHPDDARDMGAGILLIANAFFATGAKRVLLPVSGKIKKEFGSAEELGELKPEHFTSTRLLATGFHPQGTAGMGRVVDVNLKLIGADRIFVCDASVLPDSPGVNPQVTIMALSLRLAGHLAQKLSG